MPTAVAAAAHHLPPDATADLLLLKSRRRSPEELRGHKFFVEVTAPSMAGSLNSTFWLREVPRVCQADEAVWHAAVSLAVSHEAYLFRSPPRSRLALTHFNAAIRALTEDPSSARGEAWRTLVLSTMFACVCIFEGQLEQASFHFRSGCNLLHEAERNERAAAHPSQQVDEPGDAEKSRPSPRRPRPSPVSLSSIRSMLVSIEMSESKFDRRRTSEKPRLLTPDGSFSLWSRYQVPTHPTRRLTPESLRSAGEAAESLFMTLIVASRIHAKKMQDLYAEGGYDMVRAAGSTQANPPELVDAFRNIQRAARIFEEEIESRPRIRPTEMVQLRRAYLSLCIIQSSNLFILGGDPDEPDPDRRFRSLPALCSHTLDLAEEACGLETTVGCHRGGGPVSSVTLMNPVTFVAKAGFGRRTRQRAIGMLHRPRLEGVAHSRLAASLAQKMVDREAAATREYLGRPDLDGITVDNPTSWGWDGAGESGESIHPLARICNYTLQMAGGRYVRVGLRTWKEWLEGEDGEEYGFTW